MEKPNFTNQFKVNPLYSLGLMLFLCFGLFQTNAYACANSTLDGIINSTVTSCDVSNNGTAKITAFGGVPGYTYLWNDPNGQTTATATGLDAGEYTVVVTDSDGCTIEKSVEVTYSQEGIWIDFNRVDATCDNANDGYIHLEVTLGSPPYIYEWSNGPNTINNDGLAPGEYCVTVSDQAGCAVDQCFTIYGESIDIEVGTVNATCEISNDGKASVNDIDGGESPYTFLWDDGQTYVVAYNLSAGPHSVTVTDDNGCYVVENFEIELSPEGVWIMLTSTPSECGGATGTAYAGAMSGVEPYTYLWDDGQTTVTATGLPAGEICVLVTDDNGCSNTECIIVESDSDLDVTVVTSDVNGCTGGNDGSATAQVSNGNTPYTYLWNNGETTQTISGLSPGTYSVTVEDANGCSGIDSGSVDGSSNPPDGGNISTNDPTTICIDGNPDPIDVDLNGATGSNSQWVITDADGVILALPSGPPFDLDGAGAGVCLIWHLSFEDGLTGALVGNNAMTDLVGCYNLSNSITVTRNDAPDGGNIATNDPTTICIDGTPDPIDVTLSGNTGSNSQWVITDEDGVILALPTGPPFDLDGAGVGVCLIWHLSYEDGLTGAVMGNNAMTDLNGCYNLSNSITVTRTELSVSVSTTDADCGVGGSATVTVNSGTAPYTYLWSNDGTDATIDDLSPGSYTVTVTDDNGCVDIASGDVSGDNSPDGGSISTNDPTTICIDGTPDPIDVTLTGNTGANSRWVITDTDGNILGLPTGPPFDLDGAGAGVCLIWHLSHEDGLTGLVMGNNVNTDLDGCYDFSDFITVTRNDPEGGNISTNDPTTICIDGTPDPIDVTLTGNVGGNSRWVITDVDGNILGLPTGPPFDLDGAGAGVCLIWHLSHEDGLTGLAMGNNTNTDLSGCYEFSNSITVTRNDPDGGDISTNDPTTICIDGTPDPIDVTLTGNVGGNSRWVITDVDGNILGLPTGPPFDLDGAGAGVCLIWHLSHEDGLTGLAMGNNTNTDLSGCYEFSNSITVTRNDPDGGDISTNDPTTICIDGTPDPIDVDLTGNVGGNSQWVITDADGVILALPTGPPFDLDGAGAGVCLIWHLSFEDGLTGAMMGNNALTDLNGCYDLSNSITVTRHAAPEGQAVVDMNAGRCAGDVGAASVNVSSGAMPYTYLWSTNETDASISGLGVGTYSVVVTDANGCTFEDSVDIIEEDDGVDVGDYVWLDLNHNGIQDAGEDGVADFTVRLLSAGPDGILCTFDDVIEDVETTDANGLYLFECVDPGEYVIEFLSEDVPDGYTFTAQDQGNDNQDSDADTFSGKSHTFTVTAGQDDDLSIDAGIHLICDNLTEGGTIRLDQEICQGDTPNPLTNWTSPSGGYGDIEYLWMSTTATPIFDPNTWTPIPNSNAPEYAPGPLTETTYFIRCARRAGCDDYQAESNVVTITVITCINNTSFIMITAGTNNTSSNSQINVHWMVSPETDFYNYFVERSYDGTHFIEIGQVNGTGNANGYNEYDFMDREPKLGKNYYRVKQVGLNTDPVFSDIVEAVYREDGPMVDDIFVYPNPVGNTLNIESVEPITEDATVQLFNNMGQVVAQYQIAKDAPFKPIDLRNLASGQYFLRVLYDSDDKEATLIRVIKR